MAASAGIAKRATIDVGFTDTSFIDNMERFNRLLKGSNNLVSSFHGALDRTDQSLSEFNQHMDMFADRNGAVMDRVRQQDNDTTRTTDRLKQTSRQFANSYDTDKDKINSANERMNESERQRYQNAINNERGINESLSRTLTHYRRNDDKMADSNAKLKERLNNIGNASRHNSDIISSANGRVARSFHVANNGIDHHVQSIRSAQSRDYHWLRTAQDMSGATLGLGAAFYKGTKDAIRLQQAYIHAGNMAHNGGEKLSQVQHDINNQWRIGSQLSIKYGISQDQIADGYKALVARGYTTNEALHTQKSLLQAAIASGDSYNDVVQGTTNVLDAYNLRSNNAATMTNNTKKVTDEMAYSADQTASNFKDLSTGMAYVAATAHTTNQPISETSSALGILSNKGMQASMAGVGLRKVLNSFLSINKKGQQAQVMQQLGLNQNSFRTASGHLKSLGQLMTILNNKTKNMGSAERGAVFHRFFGATGQEAALNLASDTKGLALLNKQVEKSQTMGNKKQGYVALLSGQNMKSAQNQLHKFEQAWQAFTITSAREILPTLVHALRHVDVYLAKMNDLSPRAKKWTIFGALAVAAISPISYAIFGIQSAFHGVELTLLHVRKLFSEPLSNNMSNSAYKNAEKQKEAALLNNEDTGRSSYMDQLGQYEFDHPHLTKMRLHRQRLGARMWATNRGALSHLTNIGGDASEMAKPTMLARLNPLNRSARFFTHQHLSWLPGIHRLPTVTGNSASYLLRGSGTGMLERAGGSILGKANWITGIASALPFIYNMLKRIDKTRIGGKIFGPFNRAIIKGLRGPVRSIDRSFGIIKRDAFKAIRPITNEWHSMFSSTNKSSRANLHGLQQFVHVTAHLFAGLWRTTAKVLGDILKATGHVIGGMIKAFRGGFTIIGGVVDVLTGHFRRGFHLIGHGSKITASGMWNVFSGALKGIGHIASDVFGGMLSTIQKISSELGNLTHLHPIKATERLFHSHASGGAIPQTEMSLVNERGQESAYNPHTNTFRMLGNNGPQVVKLFQGEHVLDAQDTYEILHNGLGRGVTLPGYANGTDTLKNLKRVHGTQAISKTHQNDIDNLDAFKNKVSSAGKSANAIKKLFGAGKNVDMGLNGVGKGVMHSNDLLDAADVGADLMGKGRMSNKIGHAGLDLGNSAGATGIGALIGGPVGALVGAGVGITAPMLEKKLGINGHTVAKVTHDALNGIKHIGLRMGQGIQHSWNGAKRIGRNALRGIRSFGRHALTGAKRIGSRAWHGIRRFGRGTIRFGRRMFRGGRRLLSHAGHGIARFSRRTWSSAKRLGRRLWTGIKHVAGRMWSSTKRIARRMWNSAKRTGRNIWRSTRRVGRDVWNDSKRVARNVGHSAVRLWNRTKRGASRTWSTIVRGAGRMASRAKSIGSRAWSAIKSGAETAKNVADHAMGTIVSWAHKAAHAVHWALTLGGHLGHHANGGRIMHNELSLVGERGPEAAYNARTGSIRMLGLNGPQIAELIAGESVLTNTQTNRLLHGGLGRGVRLPAYAHGTNARLSGPASRSSVFSITGMFNGKRALRNMSDFSDKAKDIWDKLSDHITKVNSDLSDTNTDIVKHMSKKINDLNDDLKSGLIQAAADMAEGFGDKFKKLITYARDDMESVIDKLNRGVHGIDIALRAFGGNSHVIHPIHYATGTMNGRIAYNQLGILNDAISGPRQEAILRGSNVLFPQGDNVPVPLQKGDAVLNGNQTRQLINNTTVNHYAKGSGFHLSGKLIKGITKTLGLALKGPKKFFGRVFDHVMGSPSGHQLSKGIDELSAKALNPLGDKWTKAMFDYIKSLLTPSDSGGSSSSVLLNEMHKLGDGHTYLWGAAGPNHYDCGGLVMAALHHLGMPSEHTVYPYPRIPARDATTGDIVQSATHVGVVADKDHTKYFSAYGPNLAPDSIKTQPLTNEYFTPGHPFYFRRPWKLYHEDQRNAARRQGKSGKSGNAMEDLVKSELGPSAVKWLKRAASLISGMGAGFGPGAVDTTRIPGAPGSWTKHGTQAYNIAKAVYTSALSLGLDAKHAAAMVGNAWHESAGFEYGLKVNQFGGGGGKGLFQFTGEPSKYGWTPIGQDKSILGNATPAAEHAWQHESGSPYKLAEDFETVFERGSIPAYAARANAAETAYHMFAANGGWADKNHLRIFGEAGPEVAINPRRSTADDLIMQAIHARMLDDPNSKIAKLFHAINIRHKGAELRSKVNGLMSDITNSNHQTDNRSININISFGDVVVNSNNGNVNTGAVSNKIKRAINMAIQKAAYEARRKLGLN